MWIVRMGAIAQQRPSTVPGYRSTVLEDSPTSYWRLGESSGTSAIDEVGGNTGTYVNTPTLGQTGALFDDADTSVLFTSASSEYVTMGDVLDFNNTEAFSLEAWFNISTTGSHYDIVAKGLATGTFAGYALDKSAADVFRFSLINTAGGGNFLEVNTSASGFLDGTWHHIVVTYNGTSLASGVAIYLDGVSKTLSVISNSLSSTTLTAAEFNIGALNNSFGFINGSVDEVAVYSSVLSSTRVLEHYNVGTLGIT